MRIRAEISPVCRHQATFRAAEIILEYLGEVVRSAAKFFRAQMHMKPLIIGATLACGLVTAALADMTIQIAKIAKGELIITGNVPPNTAKVVLTISPSITVEVVPDRRGRFA